MSITITRQVWAQRLHTTQKIVLLCLADHADNNGLSFPGRELIAAETGLSKRSVSEAITMLQGLGFLTIEKGERNKNRYIVSSAPAAPLVVQDVPHSSAPAAPLVVQDVPHSSAGAAPLVVQDVPHSSAGAAPPIQINHQLTTNRTTKEPFSATADGVEKKSVEKDSDKAEAKARERDPVFDAIAKVCNMSGPVHGASIGKAKKQLLKFNPPATPEEIHLFAEIYEKQHPYKKFPKWWDLVDGFGIVRNAAAVESILKGRKINAAPTDSSGKLNEETGGTQATEDLPPFEQIDPLLWPDAMYQFNLADPEGTEVWLKPLQLLGMAGGEIWIGATSSITRNWVAANYREDLARHLGSPVRIITIQSQEADHAE